MKLTCCIITRNCEEWIGLSLKSAMQTFDEIVIVDDNSTDNTKLVIDKLKDDRVKFYQQDFNYHFGKQRQYALSKATGEWVFWLDSDECLNDGTREYIEEIISLAKNNDSDYVDVQYVHFMNNFSNIDNNEIIHAGIARLHKNIPEITFTRKTHAVPDGCFEKKRILSSMKLCIYHFGYARDQIDNYLRYKRNVLRSTMHSPMQVCAWRDWHYSGQYPTRKFNIDDLPKTAKDYFEIDKYDDETIKNTDNWAFWTKRIGGDLN